MRLNQASRGGKCCGTHTQTFSNLYITGAFRNSDKHLRPFYTLSSSQRERYLNKGGTESLLPIMYRVKCPLSS